MITVSGSNIVKTSWRTQKRRSIWRSQQKKRSRKKKHHLKISPIYSDHLRCRNIDILIYNYKPNTQKTDIQAGCQRVIWFVSWNGLQKTPGVLESNGPKLKKLIQPLINLERISNSGLSCSHNLLIPITFT